MTSLLEYPARKVFVRDLTKCIRVQSIGKTESEKIKKKQREWTVECSGVEFTVTLVWIQGLVTEINKEEGFMILDDSTGKVKVSGYNNIPFISLSLTTGQYVMVIASVSRGGPLPVVNAIKLQSLAHVENAERSWSLEVMDQVLQLRPLLRMISKLAVVDKEMVASRLGGLLTYSNFVHAVSGATGSVIAMAVFYPLETVRTRLQVHVGRQAKHTPEEALDIVKNEGISSLYQGLLPVLVTLCCSNFVYFYTYNGLKQTLLEEGSKPGPFKDLLMAFVSGVINVVITNPLWVVNTRIKIQGLKCGTEKNLKASVPRYKGIIDGLYKIKSQEGLSALWNGTAASVILASNPSIQFMVYETIKRYFQQFFKSKELSGFLYFIIGAISKMVATIATYPLQILQSRFRAGAKKSENTKISQSLLDIIRREGFLGLYRGMEAKLVQTVLTAALMFLCYEKIAAFIFRVMGINA